MTMSSPANGETETLASFLRTIAPSGVVLRGRGASEHEIDRFETLAKCPSVMEGEDGSPEEYFQYPVLRFPPTYRWYLREFGYDDGLIKLGDGGECRIHRLIEYYEYERSIYYGDLPPSSVVISQGGLSNGKALHYGEAALDDDESRILPEPTVIEHGGGNMIDTVSQSFRHHLYQKLWLDFRSSASDGPPQIVTFPGRMPLDLVAEHAARMGFRPHWFSDAYGYYAETADAWVACYCRRQRSILTLGGRDLQTQSTLTAALRAQLPQ